MVFSFNDKSRFLFGITINRSGISEPTFWLGARSLSLKTGRGIDPGWEKQLLNYLRATEIEVGLLFNFGPEAQFRRYIFENDRKKIRGNRRSSEEKK